MRLPCFQKIKIATSLRIQMTFDAKQEETEPSKLDQIRKGGPQPTRTAQSHGPSHRPPGKRSFSMISWRKFFASDPFAACDKNYQKLNIKRSDSRQIWIQSLCRPKRSVETFKLDSLPDISAFSIWCAFQNRKCVETRFGL